MVNIFTIHENILMLYASKCVTLFTSLAVTNGVSVSHLS
jgi:hypothetical protein